VDVFETSFIGCAGPFRRNQRTREALEFEEGEERTTEESGWVGIGGEVAILGYGKEGKGK